MYKTLSVSQMLRPVMSETSKTAKIILVLYWGLGYYRSHIRSMVQYSKVKQTVKL